MVCAKNSGLILKESHDAVVEEVDGHMSIHGRERIIKEVHFFVLGCNKKKSFIFMVLLLPGFTNHCC